MTHINIRHVKCLICTRALIIDPDITSIRRLFGLWIQWTWIFRKIGNFPIKFSSWKFDSRSFQLQVYSAESWDLCRRLLTQRLHPSSNIEHRICWRLRHLDTKFYTTVYSPQESEENVRTKSSPDWEYIHKSKKIRKMITRKIHSYNCTSTRKCETSMNHKYHKCCILKYGCYWPCIFG